MPTSTPSDQLKTTSSTLSPSDVDMKTKPVVFKKGPMKLIDERTFAIVPARAICDRAMTNSMFRVLCGYCLYASAKGVTMVGQRRVAREIGVSQPTVSRNLAKILKLGYMKRGKRPRHKYGTAQTHIIIRTDPKGPMNVDDEIDAAIAADNHRDDAPPVPIGGFDTSSRIMTYKKAA
jgi:hypothetical protein